MALEPVDRAGKSHYIQYLYIYVYIFLFIYMYMSSFKHSDTQYMRTVPAVLKP